MAQRGYGLQLCLCWTVADLRLNGGADSLQNGGQICHHCIGGDAYDTIAPADQMRFTLRIELSLLLFRVIGAVYFNDETQLIAAKVGNESTDRMLPPEADTIKQVGAKAAPQPLLARRLSSSQIARQIDLILGRNVHAITLPARWQETQ